MNGFINQFPYSDFHEMNLDWIIKEVKRLGEKLDTFVDYNKIKFADPVEWSIARQYEALTLVFDVIWQEVAPGEEIAVRGYNLYMSIKPVPKGINIHNEDFWQLVIPFTIDDSLNVNSTNVVTNQAITRQFNIVDLHIDNTNERIDTTNERVGTLSTNLETEIHDRIVDDHELAEAIQTNAANITENTSDITTLTNRVDNLSQTITPGGTTGDAELADIRVGADGVTYPTAGDAVRAQVSGLQSEIDSMAINNNLFDSDDIVEDGYYSAANGNFVSDNGYWALSTLIDVRTNKTIYINVPHDRATDYGFYTCYREDGTWAGEGGGLTITTLPHSITLVGANTAFVRISFSTHFSTANAYIGYDSSLTYTAKGLENKVNTSDIVQATGNSESKIMSQKAVTDALSGITGAGEHWKDTTLCAFGTSLTDTGNAPNTFDPNGDPTGKYLPYLINLGDFAELNPLPSTSGIILDHDKSTNYGIAGGGINGQILYYLRYYLHDGPERVLGNYADLITIEGSVNDFAANIPLGNVGDITPYTHYLLPDGTNDGTFAGACYCAFTEAQAYAPNSTVVFLTDSTGKLYNGTNYDQVHKNGLNLYQIDYINMAKKVAKFVGIPVIDCGSESMINAQNPDYLVDWIHHTYLGGYQYAKTIWSKLKNIYPKSLSLPNEP